MQPLAEVSEVTLFASFAILSNVETILENSFYSSLLNHDLLEKSGLVNICAQKSQEQCKTLLYLFFCTAGDDVPKSLRVLYTSNFHTWDSCAMRAIACSASPKLALFANSHFFLLADFESSDKDVLEVSIDENVKEKRVAMRSFD